MWGFLKCNYSYTKILIVLLFSLSCRFLFPGQGDSPVRACPGSSRGWRRKEPAGAGAQDQGGRWGSPARQPPASHRSNKTQGHSAIPREGVGLKVRGPGLACKLHVHGSGTWDSSLGGSPGASLKGDRATEMLRWPLFSLLPPFFSGNQTDFLFIFFIVARYT